MLRWLGLRPEEMIADAIASYEDEIEVEKARLEELQKRLAEARLAVAELEHQGDTRHLRSARMVERDLQHRVRFSEQLIARMQRILEHFRQRQATGR